MKKIKKSEKKWQIRRVTKNDFCHQNAFFSRIFGDKKVPKNHPKKRRHLYQNAKKNILISKMDTSRLETFKNELKKAMQKRCPKCSNRLQKWAQNGAKIEPKPPFGRKWATCVSYGNYHTFWASEPQKWTQKLPKSASQRGLNFDRENVPKCRQKGSQNGPIWSPVFAYFSTFLALGPHVVAQGLPRHPPKPKIEPKWTLRSSNFIKK